ncbi:MAG TPA: nuclear transport factor 2 family protein [Gammaproteobacteria bacterium]|nr:nuclear transport factor 2 family protein [Gammaproteobacteria bacterium]
MKRNSTGLVLLLAGIAFVLPAFARASHDLSSASMKAIAAADATWESAANARNYARLATVYGPDARVMPPGHASISGQGNIAGFWKAALKPVGKVALHYSETHGMGAYAFRTGTFTMRNAAGHVLQTGKFVEIWHKGADGWKMHRDIFNGNPAPSGSR